MQQASAALIAKWYRRLGASNIERPNGALRAEQPGGRMRHGAYLAMDRPRTLVSWEHESLAAACWRFPVVRRTGRGRPNVAPGKQRRILRMLAEGATTREIARKVRVSLSLIGRLRKAVRQWKDPDDEA